MPQVPGGQYEPYFVGRAPEGIESPRAPNVPPGAFGLDVARAIATFGGDLGHAGQDVFEGAINQRRMEIENNVRDAVTDWGNRMETVKNDFMTKEGFNAGPAAMNAALAQINSERVAARAKIAAEHGVYGAKLFDDQSAMMQRSLTREIGGWSAQQYRKGQKDSIEARIGLLENRIQSAPDDEEAYNVGLSEVSRLLDQRSALIGLSPEAAQLDRDTVVSRLTQRRIIGYAIRQEDEKAQALLDQAIADKTLKGDAADATQKALQSQIRQNLSFARSIQTYDDTIARNEAQDAVSQIAARNVTTDPKTGEPIINPRIYQELATLAQRNPRAQQYVQERINWAERQQDRAAKEIVTRTNPDVLSGMTKNMFDTARPTQERDVLIAETNGQLSHKDGAWLRMIIKNRDTGDDVALKDPLFKVANDSAKALIEGTTVADRMLNAGNYAAFQFTFLSEYLKRKREGKLEPDDLNMANPDGLLRKTMETYMPGIGQTIRANGGVGAPATPAPAPVVPAPVPETKPEITLPPKADRVDNKAYLTNQGTMFWDAKRQGWSREPIKRTKPQAEM